MRSTFDAPRRSTTALQYATAMVLMSLLLTAAASAQNRATQAPASTARADAPIDLTGYWVSVVTQDWRWRMVTPAKGDYASIPITLEAKKAGDNWDPAKDEATGEQCKSYGAPALMAVPTRLRITWQDASTLKVETDYGMQTRLFRFTPARAAASAPTWQGSSVAKWETSSLTVTTDRLRAGYLRKNGVPYSADARLTEFWDAATDPTGNKWIVVTSVVYDPKYLLVPFTTSLQFMQEKDGSKWDPTPCSARW